MVDSNKKPFFSVCIPNYNYAKYLEETVNSVLQQEFADFEIIIVDNNSSDGSWDLINSFSDPRIRKFKNRYNIGFAPNLQAAVAKATGKFINLLSADDKMKPGILKKYYDLIEKEPDQEKLFILCDVTYINETSEEYAADERRLDTFQGKSTALNEYKGGGEILAFTGIEVLQRVLPIIKNPAPFLSVMVSAALVKDVEGFNAVRTIGPDKFFFYKLLFKNPKVLYLRLLGYQYRIHSSVNMTAQSTSIKQQIDDYLNIIEFGQMAEAIGVSSKKMIYAFHNRVCYRTGLASIWAGNAWQGWRMVGCFLFFPQSALKNYRFYLLIIMLVFYPISHLTSKVLRSKR